MLLLAVLLGSAGATTHVWAQVSQEGDNEGDSDQDGEAASGDAASGSQITGIVVEDGGRATVRASNTSRDSEATSGDADVSSSTTVRTGPVSDGEGTIAQEGENTSKASQAATALTGDAISGTQVIGAVVSGVLDADLTNESDDAEATSGDASSQADVASIESGPRVDATPVGAVLGASIVQDGDNDATADQLAEAESGDAAAGAQITGSVVSGTLRLVLSSASEDARSTSGDAGSSAEIDGASAGPELVITATEDATGSIEQTRDNALDVAQSSVASTGDGVAGSQVFGSVVAGTADVAAVNSAIGATAESGSASSSSSVGDAHAGPSLTGSVDRRGAAPSIVQARSNDLELGQSAATTAGDAVAGSQVNGLVEQGGRARVRLSNDSSDDSTLTGSASSDQRVGTARSGPTVVLTLLAP